MRGFTEHFRIPQQVKINHENWSARRIVGPDYGSELIDILMVFLKEIFNSHFFLENSCNTVPMTA